MRARRHPVANLVGTNATFLIACHWSCPSSASRCLSDPLPRLEATPADELDGNFQACAARVRRTLERTRAVRHLYFRTTYQIASAVRRTTIAMGITSRN